MPRTVSADDKNETVATVFAWVVENHDDVIVERDGQPVIAFMPYDQFVLLTELRTREQQRAAAANDTPESE